MVGYSVSIAETSKELSAKERILLKDTTNAIKLDEATQVEPVIIYPEMYAVLEIHNEKSDNVDYNNYIIKDKNGDTFVTGSNSFFDSFMQIYEEMKNESEEWGIKCYRVPSKNYKGKEFLACSVI